VVVWVVTSEKIYEEETDEVLGIFSSEKKAREFSEGIGFYTDVKKYLVDGKE